MKKKIIILSIINLISFVAVVTVNALANILPINGFNTGELSDALPNLFVPAGLTFSIWALIYTMLTFFVFYQFYSLRKKESTDYIEIIGWLFFISSLANIGWIFTWHYKQINLSFFLMMIILITLILIVLRLRPKRKYAVGFERVAIYHTFSVYLGWISVATIANITAVLVNMGWNGFGISEQIWTMTVIFVAIGLALISILFKKDIPYALVIDWALAGILIKRYATEGFGYLGIIVISSIGIILISSLSVYKFLIKH
ncbi:MAG: tryptophan-rich sensory protein [Clostridiales bacterium]|nr:tryptophan-rich sensory protein [Clostridiales bacterium]